ncbi:hypothetical protein AKJ41_00825 [candidate division MSBL1 archaeon SCGC-AAA259O05]|uniref:Helicase HerA central domain-containing protein n=1 Tax=candidate division MSBL1 archaeon SCGC-AAA259O05 TaxID=1698271 RepID=A0A133V5F0_9EURY|nr:hypothetical protein AKJ41_00825 [candidate division MSBL1 archaeon SCGC-AAA259O05]
MINNNRNNGIILGQKNGKKPNKEWVLSLGHATNKKNEKVQLDSSSPHVIFVCGARGSGKSYTLGVLAEEIARKDSDIATVIIDPIGVFWSMKYPNQEEEEIKLLEEIDLENKGIENVQVFVPTGYKSDIPEETFDTDFSFRASDLKTEDWCLTFGIDRYSPQGLLLDRAIEKVREGYTRQLGDKLKGGSRDVAPNENFSIEDLLECINHDRELVSKEKGFKGSTRRALTSRLTAAKDWGIFGKEKRISDMIEAKKISVIDISFLSENIGSLVLGIFARKILAARKAAAREEAVRDLKGEEEKRAGSIPPAWLMVDEAHNFAPSSGKTAATDPLVEYVKQGRRPGLSAVLSTQQPSALNSKIISQLDILLTHRLTFENDIKEVWKRIPTALPEELKEAEALKKLPEGTALTADNEMDRAFITSIRPRISQHEGRERVTKTSSGGETRESFPKRLELEEEVQVPETQTEPVQEEYLEVSSKTEKEIPVVPFQIELNKAVELAKSERNRFLRILWATEKVRRISRYYYPILSFLIDYHRENKESINLRIHMDGLTGELIKKTNEKIQRTRGVRKLSELSESELEALFQVLRENPLEPENLEGPSNAIDRLLERKLIRSYQKEGEHYVDVAEGVDIPQDLPEKSLLLAEELPERESKSFAPENRIDRLIGEEKLIETLEVYGDLEIIEQELFYYPYWIANLKNKEGTRILAIDGVYGVRDNYVEKMLRRRINF